MDLNKDVKYVKGVGPNRVKLLNKLGIFTLKDLISYYPRTYEDRSKPKNIIECINGEEALIEGIACSRVSNVRLRGKTMQKLIKPKKKGAAHAAPLRLSPIQMSAAPGSSGRLGCGRGWLPRCRTPPAPGIPRMWPPPFPGRTGGFGTYSRSTRSFSHPA